MKRRREVAKAYLAPDDGVERGQQQTGVGDPRERRVLEQDIHGQEGTEAVAVRQDQVRPSELRVMANQAIELSDQMDEEDSADGDQPRQDPRARLMIRRPSDERQQHCGPEHQAEPGPLDVHRPSDTDETHRQQVDEQRYAMVEQDRDADDVIEHRSRREDRIGESRTSRGR